MNVTPYPLFLHHRKLSVWGLMLILAASGLSGGLPNRVPHAMALESLPVADTLIKKLSKNTVSAPSQNLPPLLSGSRTHQVEKHESETSGKKFQIPFKRQAQPTASSPYPVVSSQWINELVSPKPIVSSSQTGLPKPVLNLSSNQTASGTGSARHTSSGTKKRSYVERDGGYIFQGVSEDDFYPGNGASSASSVSSQSTVALKGRVTTLTVNKGRSQIIKFAQPINRIAIADPTLADIVPLSPEQLMINGKQRGATSLVVWDKNGQEGIFDLQVLIDNTPLLDAIEAIAPNEKIVARITDDSLVLSGQVSNSIILDEIRRLAAAYGYKDANFIDLTETPTPQVVLQVKIVEASRSVVQNLSTSFAFNHGDFKLGRFLNIPQPAAAAGAPAAPARVSVFPTRDTFNQQFRNQTSGSVGGIFGGIVPLSRSVDFNLQQAFDMLETIGKVSTLANPTLVCTHGREATFLAGGEFPFVQGTDQNGSPLISFKNFGVELAFTPWISSRTKRVELRVAPSVSQLDNSTCVAGAAGSTVCGLTKRNSSTVVEMNDGETLLISGLISRDEQKNMSAVPFINNVPILGALFKNPNFQKRESELVVLVTPHIMDQGDYGKNVQDPG
jgi:pilus assembly protein CpaC